MRAFYLFSQINAPENSNIKGRGFEELVAKVEMARAAKYLSEDFSVVVDDTNLGSSVEKWRNFARHKAEFDIYRMQTPLEDCIANDNKRSGKAHVGIAVIHRQFLVSGRLPIDVTKNLIIVDVDGTLSDHAEIRSPYDETKVLLDRPYQNIIDIVNEHHANGDTVLIVSGRHSTCGDDTAMWLRNHGVNFDFIFMRHGWDNSHDYVVKQQILDEILTLVPIENIIKIFDDRSQVIHQCWIKNNLPIQPVFANTLIPIEEWSTEHTIGCEFKTYKGFGRCPQCGAIESF